MHFIAVPLTICFRLHVDDAVLDVRWEYWHAHDRLNSENINSSPNSKSSLQQIEHHKQYIYVKQYIPELVIPITSNNIFQEFVGYTCCFKQYILEVLQAIYSRIERIGH